jgi:hypothetical protein
MKILEVETDQDASETDACLAVASKMFKLLWAKQILIALSILLNKGRYLDQGQPMTSFRFWCRKPAGSHSSSA